MKTKKLKLKSLAVDLVDDLMSFITFILIAIFMYMVV